jgi:hypothetical protein
MTSTEHKNCKLVKQENIIMFVTESLTSKKLSFFMVSTCIVFKASCTSPIFFGSGGKIERLAACIFFLIFSRARISTVSSEQS